MTKNGAMAFDSSLDRAREVLREVFGHADFRGYQGEIIEQVLAGAVQGRIEGRGAILCHPGRSRASGGEPGSGWVPVLATIPDKPLPRLSGMTR